MYRIDYEEYWNDFFRKQHQKTFASLSDIEEWIFGQMQRDYRGDNLVIKKCAVLDSMQPRMAKSSRRYSLAA